MAVNEHAAQTTDRANETDRPPVVFIHGLWLLADSWASWATSFEEAGYTAITPGWPDDPSTVAQARAHPEVFAGKTIKQIADHYAEVIGQLKAKPVLVGHSFGGLLAQMLAGRGLAAASVAISPAPSAACCQFRYPRSDPRGLSSVIRRIASGRSCLPMTSFATRSPTQSARRRPSDCMRPTRCPDRAR